MASHDEHNKRIGQLVAKCWADDSFKRKLLTDPAGTLKAEGIEMELPEGMTIKTVENTDKVWHLVIPAKPSDLTDEDLEQAAGGYCRGSGVCHCGHYPYSRYSRYCAA